MADFSPWIDGSISGFYLLVTMAAGVLVRRYVGRVEDFLVAGREIDVFLVQPHRLRGYSPACTNLARLACTAALSSA